jgi:hypothetical protein
MSSPPQFDEELQEIAEKLVARRRQFGRDMRALSREFEQEMEVLRHRIGAREVALGDEADGLIIEGEDHILYIFLLPKFAQRDVKVNIKRNLRRRGRRELRISCVRESVDPSADGQGPNRDINKRVTRLEIRDGLSDEVDPNSLQVTFEGITLQVRISRVSKS